VGIISFPHVQGAEAPFTWGYQHLQSLPGLIFLNLNFQTLDWGFASEPRQRTPGPLEAHFLLAYNRLQQHAVQ
jgi:hypothetical protein